MNIIGLTERKMENIKDLMMTIQAGMSSRMTSFLFKIKVKLQKMINLPDLMLFYRCFCTKILKSSLKSWVESGGDL